MRDREKDDGLELKKRKEKKNWYNAICRSFGCCDYVGNLLLLLIPSSHIRNEKLIHTRHTHTHIQTHLHKYDTKIMLPLLSSSSLDQWIGWRKMKKNVCAFSGQENKRWLLRVLWSIENLIISSLIWFVVLQQILLLLLVYLSLYGFITGFTQLLFKSLIVIIIIDVIIVFVLWLLKKIL